MVYFGYFKTWISLSLATGRCHNTLKLHLVSCIHSLGLLNGVELGNFVIDSCADTVKIATPRDSIC